VWLRTLLAIAAPPLCWACGGPARADETLCRGCRRSLRRLGGEPVLLPGGVEAWAPVAYDGPARALVHALKFSGALAVADAMAAEILAVAPRRLLGDGNASAEMRGIRLLGNVSGDMRRGNRSLARVPVPGHPRRVRRRGFDQADRLAEALARRSGLRIRRCLRRGGSPVPQTGRPRSARLAAGRAEMEVAPAAPAPKRALLVDDVITTGATVATCAATLRSGGAEAVAAIAYARTSGR